VKPQENVEEKGTKNDWKRTKTIENIKQFKTDHVSLCSAWGAEINCSGN
jgi:hypothetical protein